MDINGLCLLPDSINGYEWIETISTFHQVLPTHVQMRCEAKVLQRCDGVTVETAPRCFDEVKGKEQQMSDDMSRAIGWLIQGGSMMIQQQLDFIIAHLHQNPIDPSTCPHDHSFTSVPQSNQPASVEFSVTKPA